MLITEDYRQTQKTLHEDPNYGTASVQYAPMVAKLINSFEVQEVLDYGAGKLRLLKTIADKRLVRHKFRYIPYEPADDRYSEAPRPCELVVCIDVLEHIEPDLLDNVLDDLRRLTGEYGFFTVHCGPAVKVLTDGRNAHLTQQPLSWWLPKFLERFELQTAQKTEGGFWVMVTPKD
jgi:hypothetical protein